MHTDVGPDSSSTLGNPTSASQHFGGQPGLGVLCTAPYATSNPRPRTKAGDRDQKGLPDPGICKQCTQSWTRSEGLRVPLRSATLSCRLEAFELFCRAASTAGFYEKLFLPEKRREAGLASQRHRSARAGAPIAADIWSAKCFSRLTPASTSPSLHPCWQPGSFPSAEQTGLICINRWDL